MAEEAKRQPDVELDTDDAKETTIQLEEKLEKKMIEISTSDIVSISNNTAQSISELFIDKGNYVNKNTKKFC